jgi:hypothetical protein
MTNTTSTTVIDRVRMRMLAVVSNPSRDEEQAMRLADRQALAATSYRVAVAQARRNLRPNL